MNNSENYEAKNKEQMFDVQFSTESKEDSYSHVQAARAAILMRRLTLLLTCFLQAISTWDYFLFVMATLCQIFIP